MNAPDCWPLDVPDLQGGAALGLVGGGVGDGRGDDHGGAGAVAVPHLSGGHDTVDI